MKYKPCCGVRCTVPNCETREQGGCYCLCRTKDHLDSIEKFIKGNSYVIVPSSIYILAPTLEDKEVQEPRSIKETAPLIRDALLKRIRTYELG